MTFNPSLLSAKIDNLMGKFFVEDGMFFKSITGLALGAYGFRLSQFSTNGDLLFTSDYQYFAIQKKVVSIDCDFQKLNLWIIHF